jgi:hypothetical protein
LKDLPTTVDGVASGQIDFNAALVVARNTAKMRPAQVGVVEAEILEAAATLPPGLLRHKAEAIAVTHDAAVLRRDANRAREIRSLRIGPDRDGVAAISGVLTSICAAELRASLEPHMTPSDRHDRRSAEQRRHDALQEVCQSRSGGRGVMIVAGVEAMMGEDGPPALLQGLIPFSQEDFEGFVDTADISAALRDLDGNLGYSGRKSRRHSKAQRRARAAVNPTCAFQGCTRPAGECTAHHLIEFSRRGETTIETEVPLCTAHQDRIHRDGWWIASDGKGDYLTLPPGHPDSPRNRMTPEEYIRWRRQARFGRRQKRKSRKSAASPAQPAAR